MKTTYLKMNKELFQEKLEKVNKKLVKYDQEVKVLSEKESIVDGFIEIEVELSEPEITGKQNVEYLGMISFKNGIKEIYNINSNFVLGDLPDDKFVCEYCNVNRYRSRFFFFLEDGKLKTIGSTCVNEYFGYDILKMLHTYTFALESFVGEKGFRQYYGIPIEMLIGYTAYSTNNFNTIWKSQEKYGYESTISDICGIYSDIKHSNDDPNNYNIQKYNTFCILHKDENTIDETKKLLIEKYQNLIPQNDFEHNIKNNLFYEDGTLRDSIIKEGIVAYVIWKINNDLKKSKLEKFDKESEFLGEVKEKLELNLSVKNTFDLQTAYGYCQLVLFNDEVGNSLKWYNSSKNTLDTGETYKIKGTVKKHEMYLAKSGNIIKTTVLTRCKIIN